MKFNIAGYTRNLLPFAVLSAAVSMLILSACGGGGSSGTSGSGGNSLTQMGGVLQGAALNLTPTVSTFAGLSSLNTNADGTGGAASFSAPLASVSDGTNLYIADSSNNTIRKVVIATGVVTTLAGSSVAAGSLDSTTAGTATTFNGPSGITTDGTNLYITDTVNNSIREISPAAGTALVNMTSTTAVVSTLVAAGTFSNPSGITTDNNVLYVADTGKHKIRIISPAGGDTLATMSSATAVTSILAGPTSTTSGLIDSTISSTSVRFTSPKGIIVYGGYLYVADTGNNRIRMVKISDGTTTSLTAGSTSASPGYVDGPAGYATFNGPTGITTDSTFLYVSDTHNSKIRKVDIKTGYTTSLTGGSDLLPLQGFTDGTGANATFNAPSGITTTIGDTKLYVSDTNNNTIRQVIISSGQVSTLAGVATSNNSAHGTGMAARMDTPQYSTTDGTNLYITDCNSNARTTAEIRKVVIATGVVTTLAGSAVPAITSSDGTGITATFVCPKGITTDGTNLYVVDNNTVRMIAASGVGATLANMAGASAVVSTMVSTGFTAAAGITTDGVNLYVADSGNVVKIAPPTGASLSSMAAASGVVSTITGSGLASATGITTNGKSLFVADNSSNKVFMITPPTGISLSSMNAASAVVSSVTGASGVAVTAGFADGAATTASFAGPTDITTDGTNLYVVDQGNNKIRMIAPTGGATLANINPASAVVSSITGTSGVSEATLLGTGYADGTGSATTFNGPTGITTDGHSLYVTDGNLGNAGTFSGTIRQIK